MTNSGHLESGEFLIKLAQVVQKECGVKPPRREAAFLPLRGRDRKASEMRQALVLIACLRLPPTRYDTLMSVLDMQETAPRLIVRRARRRFAENAEFRVIVTAIITKLRENKYEFTSPYATSRS